MNLSNAILTQSKMDGMDMDKVSENLVDFRSSRLEITDSHSNNDADENDIVDGNTSDNFESNFVSFERFEERRSEEEFVSTVTSLMHDN